MCSCKLFLTIVIFSVLCVYIDKHWMCGNVYKRIRIVDVWDVTKIMQVKLKRIQTIQLKEYFIDEILSESYILNQENLRLKV